MPSVAIKPLEVTKKRRQFFMFSAPDAAEAVRLCIEDSTVAVLSIRGFSLCALLSLKKC